MRTHYRVTPREKAEELIQRYILDNGLVSGDCLPAERMLCEMWGLTRSTLRSAVNRLQQAGILSARIGSGTYVAQNKVEVECGPLDAPLSSIEAAGASLDSRVLTHEVAGATKQEAARLGITPGDPVLRVTRLNSIDGNPVSVEESLINLGPHEELDPCVHAGRSMLDLLKSEFGVNVRDIKTSVSITLLDAEHAAILRQPKGAAAYLITGVAHDSCGLPIEYLTSTCATELVRIGCQSFKEE